MFPTTRFPPPFKKTKKAGASIVFLDAPAPVSFVQGKLSDELFRQSTGAEQGEETKQKHARGARLRGFHIDILESNVRGNASARWGGDRDVIEVPEVG